MQKDTGPSCDRRTTETAERLIAIYKEHFGLDWQIYFKETVVIHVAYT